MKKQHSIRKQFSGVVLCLVAGTVLACWLLNMTLLDVYYTKNKQNTLIKAFDQIYSASEDGTLTNQSFDVKFENICASGNVTVLIISPDGTVVRSSAYGVGQLQRQFMEIILGSAGTGANEFNLEIMEQNDRYVMGQKKDARLDADFLVLWGQLADGNLMLAQTPLESIKESAAVANRLLTYVGIFAVIVSMVIINLVIKKITTPILELSDISNRMCNLDFDAKYQVRGDNEVEQLGSHINQLSDALEHTISELKSANIRLQQDIARKEEVDEMRKDFLSNVSHELKTPIALIRGYAEGLQECIQDDPESREFYCDVIIDEAEKMNIMVKKLLTLNQLEFGNDEITMERFDVTSVIRALVAKSAILLEQNGITVQFDEPAMYVWADEYKTEEVLSNYLSNAIHYAAGEKRIVISYTKKQECVRISVFNTGPPIPEEDIPHIWTKFYKVDKARTREYGGNGIGLSIVKAIMESFHQDYGVINHENGVEFYLELDQKTME
ncbi:MAG: sensor histidine kinase [Roseburia sp.]